MRDDNFITFCFYQKWVFGILPRYFVEVLAKYGSAGTNRALKMLPSNLL